MAMQMGGAGVKSDINVTPFVDIVLVLLIIFMVVTPLLSRTLDLSVPPKSDASPVDTVTTDQLILTVKGPDTNPRIFLNRDEITGGADEVKTRIADLMKGRREKVVFFQADNDLPYALVVSIMDAIRGGNAEKIGLITDEGLDATTVGGGGR
ncbi:MAG TPA: biopolymer transporter ExbD [Candidatus Polarisedimenticolia bacterium]